MMFRTQAQGEAIRAACVMLLAAVLAGGVARSAEAAQIIAGTDLDTSGMAQVAGPESDDFLTPDGQVDGSGDIGDVVNRVYQDGETYVYTHAVSPERITNASEFNTGFSPAGFDGSLVGSAGWDFEQAASAGGTGLNTDFQITWNNETDGTIDWEPIATAVGDTSPGEWWGSGEEITFFFESSIAPSDALGDYNLINSEVGTAQSFQPAGSAVIPTPGALPAGLALLGLAGAGRWRRNRRRPDPVR